MDNCFSYLIKPKDPVMERYKCYGLFGGTAAKFSLLRNSGVGLISQNYKTGFTYGLGLEYQFRLNGSLAIEWIEYWTEVPMYVDPWRNIKSLYPRFERDGE